MIPHADGPAHCVGGPSFFRPPVPQLLFFGGKGGVGKTTCATAAALHLARASRQSEFLLVSTDPAHSLADSLADLTLPENLRVIELNAQQCLEAFKAKHRQKLLEIVAKGTFFDSQDIDKILDLSLPGLDEAMALFEIGSWIDSGQYSTVLVDTAPTGHTLNLLNMPEVIKTWLRALDALLEKNRFMRYRFQKHAFRDDLDIFILDMDGALKSTETLLHDHRRCCFVVVMLAEELSILETARLLIELHREKIRSIDIVVNRLFSKSECPVCAAKYRRQQQALAVCYSRLKKSGHCLFGIPLQSEEVRGASLETFWEKATTLSAPQIFLPVEDEHHSPRIDTPLPLPTEANRLLIFAGKGGVGKTTVACATATRLVNAYPGKEVFLFSMDPAHSIADCLKRPVGPEVVRLEQGFSAIEIDAAAAYASFKAMYESEIRDVFSNVLQHFDMPFDRTVMERLLDVTPTGLNEIMALATAMDYFDANQRILILDASPTGHLIRLLEMPHMIEDWLQTIFDIMLKYNLVMHLPKFSNRLVKLSKKLKLFVNIMCNPMTTAVYIVTIPTQMAFLETDDLLASCAKAKVHTPALIINMTTIPSNCKLCSSIHQRESVVIDQYRKYFPYLHQTLVYCQGEPIGLNCLDKLGHALYYSAGAPRNHVYNI